MTRKSILAVFTSIILAIVCIISSPGSLKATAAYRTNANYKSSDSGIKYVVLSRYSASLAVQDEFYLIAATSNGKQPSFKSSNSSVASVNTYGLVKAKKAGSCKITAKISGAEASCTIKVVKTTITLNKTNLSLENGQSFQLTAQSSTNHEVSWKSSKSSVVSVSERGYVTANKVGTATISASVDGRTQNCKVTVKAPTIKLSATEKTLFRTQSFQLLARISSGKSPTWKSNKSSVAKVDENGVVTAVKHGAATISCTVDGVSKSCTIYVQQPTITLSDSSLSLQAGQCYTLTANVSTGISPSWSSSNINVCQVDSNGNLTARSKGKAYIYAKEDGVKVSCIVYVSE